VTVKSRVHASVSGEVRERFDDKKEVPVACAFGGDVEELSHGADGHVSSLTGSSLGVMIHQHDDILPPHGTC
jgi:hypothetical protein